MMTRIATIPAKIAYSKSPKNGFLGNARSGCELIGSCSIIQTSMAVITDFPIHLPLFRKGKVRHVYDLEDTLLLVASDRVSAFDCILPTGIPHKGRILTQLSAFWFDFLADIVPNHLIETDVSLFPDSAKPYANWLKDRTLWVKKTNRIDIECVVRGYLAGSGWKDYCTTGSISEIRLPKNLQQAQQLSEPIFTPAAKMDEGHDKTISFDVMVDTIGIELANTLRTLSLTLYQRAHTHALSKGIILADTKFEFGLLDNQIILIDEVLTPDSSRFWDMEGYALGQSPASFDKQIIRDYLEGCAWDKQHPAPHLPEDIVHKTSQRYQEVFERLV